MLAVTLLLPLAAVHLTTMLLALVITTALAYLSWFGVERPAGWRQSDVVRIGAAPPLGINHAGVLRQSGGPVSGFAASAGSALDANTLRMPAHPYKRNARRSTFASDAARRKGAVKRQLVLARIASKSTCRRSAR